MAKAIYLCGFMGCGKTTVGKNLAKIMGLDYADMDAYIEEREGMKIPEIFEHKGEPYFRSAETEAVSEMGKKGGIIACGGGAMLKPENAAKAAECGTVVYIDTPYELCWARISGDKNRPIVMANTKESLKEIYDTRQALYRAHSKFSVDGTGTPKEIAMQIKSLIV